MKDLRPTAFTLKFSFMFVGRLTVEEQKLEGEFRYVNSRLITNSEEVSPSFSVSHYLHRL